MSTHQHLKVVLAGRKPDLFYTPPPCVGVLAFPCLHIVDVDVALRVPSESPRTIRSDFQDMQVTEPMLASAGILVPSLIDPASTVKW